MSNSAVKEVKRWLNRPQMIALKANPRILAVKAGRRLGKTEEIGAERSVRAAYLLQGSSGFVAAKSYSKLLDDLLPGLLAGWGKRNILEGDDYVIGKTPPKHFKRPILPPLKFDHYISFRWGSGCHLVSMDHGITRNGNTTDWGMVDECKQIDPVRLDSELLKTMSGHGSVLNAQGIKWRDIPEHQSITFLTDAYIGKYDYDWIGRYKKSSISLDEIKFMMWLDDEVNKTKDPHLKQELMRLQCEAVIYLEASTEENLAVLGPEYFELQAKNSTPIDFRTSILNEEVKQIEGGFYKFLDEEIHGYEARDNNRIDSIGISDYLSGKSRNCLLDKDWMKNQPIKMGVDYGSTHCWFVACQKYANTYWYLNNFWTTNEQPEDGVDKICDYYKYQEKEHKVIELYDDPGGHKKNTDQQKDTVKVIERFNKHGWRVIHKTPANNYIPHKLKYRVWEKALDERKENQKFPKVRFNLNNAYESFYSCSKAPVIIGRQDEFQKDKSSEKDKTIEQWKATHLSDCVDMIYCTDNQHLVDSSRDWLTW
jgi:hypothetical protein